MSAASTDASRTQQQAMSQSTRAALEYSRMLRSLDAEYLTVFKNDMQVMVDQKQLSLRQALGFDIQYTEQLHEQEAERLQAILTDDNQTDESRRKVLAALSELDARYAAQSSDDYRRAADEARAQADRLARSYEAAFDRVGSSAQRTFNEILTRQTTWAK